MSSVTRISTYSSMQNLLQNLSITQGSLFEAQQQISSGYKSQTYDGLNGSVEQFTSLNAKISRLNAYQQNNSIIISRLQTTNTSLSQVLSTATDISSLIVSRRNPASGDVAFNQQISDRLTSVINALNITSEGNYLFSGTKTSVPPIKTPLPAPVAVGTPDAGYYQGSDSDYTARIQDGQELTYNVRANNPAFQKIFAAVAQAIEGNNQNDDTKLAHAYDLIASALGDLTALQATVNSNILNVQQVNSQSQTLQLYYQGLTEQLSKTDIVAVSTQAAEDQSTLQASYQVFARISSLRLSDYLN